MACHHSDLKTLIMDRFGDELIIVQPTLQSMSCMFLSKAKSTAANKFVDLPDVCNQNSNLSTETSQNEILSKASKDINKIIKEKLVALRNSKTFPTRPTDDPQI